ncbi:hypothetical protein Vretimale_9473, partial [Volvox reticuliferus]
LFIVHRRGAFLNQNLGRNTKSEGAQRDMPSSHAAAEETAFGGRPPLPPPASTLQQACDDVKAGIFGREVQRELPEGHSSGWKLEANIQHPHQLQQHAQPSPSPLSSSPSSGPPSFTSSTFHHHHQQQQQQPPPSLAAPSVTGAEVALIK